MKFVSTGSGGGILVSDEFMECSPKLAVQVHFLLKSTADVRNLVEVIWYTAGQVEISDTDIYDNSTTNPTSWAQRGSTVTPPSTAFYMKIRIYGCHSSDSTPGTARFDNVQVRLVNTSSVVANSFDPPPLTLYISGFVPTQAADSTHDLSFSSGMCRNSDNTAWCLPTWTTLIKQIDAAFAEGTNQGGMATGSVANSTAYYYNLIRKNSDETVFDICIDVSASHANTPSGWTFMRELHREFTDGSALLRPQTYLEISGGGIRSKLGTVLTGFTDSNPGTNLVTKTLPVPPGTEVMGTLSLIDATPASATYMVFSEVGSTATEPDVNNYTTFVGGVAGDIYRQCEIQRYVDASRNIEYELSQSTADHSVWFQIFSWKNHRKT